MKKSNSMQEHRAIEALFAAAIIGPQLALLDSVPKESDPPPLERMDIDVDLIEETKSKLEAKLAHFTSTSSAQADELPSFEQAIPPTTFENVLGSIRQCFGFDAGLIYVADHADQLLRCVSYMDSDGLGVEQKSFFYRFGEPSLAWKVFSEGVGYFSPKPWDDDLVNHRGLGFFKISGPIIGLPLFVGTTAVGVLVVWSRKGPTPTPDDLDHLRPAAYLAEDIVADSRQHVVLDRLARPKTFRHLQALDPFTLSYTLQLFSGTLLGGFDRVRLLRYHKSEKAFHCIAALGVGTDHDLVGNFFPADGNTFAADLCRSFLAQPAARSISGSYPGAFSDSDDSWAVVPLISGGELMGAIAADNRLSGSSISDEGLRHLTVMGALASQVASKCAVRTTTQVLDHCFSALPRCVIRKDVLGRFIEVNEAYCARVHKRREDIIGKSDYDFYPKEIADGYRLCDHRVMAERKEYKQMELHALAFQAPDWVYVSKMPLFDESGKVIGIECSFWDVHFTQARAEATKVRELLLSDVQREQRRRRVLQNLLLDHPCIAFYEANVDGSLRDVNNVMAKLLGFSSVREVLAKKSVQALYADGQEWESVISDQRLKYHGATFNRVFKRSDGSPLHVIERVHGTLESGRLTCIQAVIVGETVHDSTLPQCEQLEFDSKGIETLMERKG